MSTPSRSPLPSQSALARLLAVAAGISVANVYYAQPLLDALAVDFGIATAQVGEVVGATQAGSVLALLLLVPLGDVLPRRRLMLWQACALVIGLLGLAAAGSVWMLLGGMFVAGLLGTAMTQGLIAYAATLAAPEHRGRMVGTVQAGVVTGLLLARVVAGLLADLGGWQLVYLSSAALTVVLAIALARALPSGEVALAPVDGSYLRLLVSMPALLLRERVLRVRGILAMLMFAALNIFWSAMALPLAAPPHAMSHGAIGAFGLVGVIGVASAARSGQWADRGWAQHVTGGALLLLSLAWWPLSSLGTGTGLWLLVLGILLLDLGGQMIHVTNQSLILSAAPHASSRMIGCYMLFYAVGSGGGAVAATRMYAYAGWQGVCLLGAAVSVAALAWWAVNLRAESALCDVGDCVGGRGDVVVRDGE